MKNKSILFFNPYIGDSILASALANKFSKVFNEEVFVANINTEMNKFVFGLGTQSITSTKIGRLMELGSKVSGLIKFHTHGSSFLYEYRPEKEEEKEITNLCNTTLDELKDYKSLYILHYSYPFAKLGQLAEERGIKVYGYTLSYGNRLLSTYGKNHFPAKIWSKGFIGDRLSKLITGKPLNREDYAIMEDKPFRKGVKLFPSSRSLSTNAKNWDMDAKYLSYTLGQRVDMALHYSEASSTNLEDLCEKIHVFNNIGEMFDLINSSEFIICYDSASFHFAWLTNTPAIVKLKGGFNKEWIPKWVKEDPNYFFIPAKEMYEEEYLTYLTKGLKQLGVI